MNLQEIELCADDFKDILGFMWPARTEWFRIGLRFNIPVSELKFIEKNDSDRQFENMINKWLDIGKYCTWRAVYDALGHPTVGQNKIAEDLKIQLKQRIKGQQDNNSTTLYVFKVNFFFYRKKA